MICEILKSGAANATSAATLCALTGLTPRTLRAQIDRERQEGQPILFRTDRQGGYFLPSEDSNEARRELLAFYRVMQARSLHTLAVLKPVVRLLDVPPGQMTLNETPPPAGDRFNNEVV